MPGGQASDYTARLRAFGLGDEDMAAWRDSGLGEEAFDDRRTDRVGRRPTGSRALAVYGWAAQAACCCATRFSTPTRSWPIWRGVPSCGTWPSATLTAHSC